MRFCNAPRLICGDAQAACKAVEEFSLGRSMASIREQDINAIRES
jgi:hypothetical protein